MKLIIDRDKWSRGNDGNLLLTPDGKCCAMGFYLLATGVDPIRILGKGTLETLDVLPDERFGVVVADFDGTPELRWHRVTDDIIYHNDKPELRAAERETTLTQLFSAVGVELSFVGGGQ